MSTKKYTNELLQNAVDNSLSFAGVLRHLSLKQAGGTQSYITHLIKGYDIDTNHFTGSRWNKGQIFPSLRKQPRDILVVSREGSHRTRHSQLSRALVECGVKYKCSLCAVCDEWNEKKIVLEIDHIDGNGLDNRKENLRFLCPNCHSQQKETSRPHKYARLGER